MFSTIFVQSWPRGRSRCGRWAWQRMRCAWIRPITRSGNIGMAHQAFNIITIIHNVFSCRLLVVTFCAPSTWICWTSWPIARKWLWRMRRTIRCGTIAAASSNSSAMRHASWAWQPRCCSWTQRTIMRGSIASGPSRHSSKSGGAALSESTQYSIKLITCR